MTLGWPHWGLTPTFFWRSPVINILSIILFCIVLSLLLCQNFLIQVFSWWRNHPCYCQQSELLIHMYSVFKAVLHRVRPRHLLLNREPRQARAVSMPSTGLLPFLQLAKHPLKPVLKTCQCPQRAYFHFYFTPQKWL